MFLIVFLAKNLNHSENVNSMGVNFMILQTALLIRAIIKGTGSRRKKDNFNQNKEENKVKAKTVVIIISSTSFNFSLTFHISLHY